MKTSSLQSKIAGVMWLMTALSTLTASFFTGYLLIQSHRESIHSQLEASAASLITLGISDFAELEDFQELNLFIEDTLQMEKVDKMVRIYDPSGHLIFTTAGENYDQLPDELPNRPQKPAFSTVGGHLGRYESLVVPYLGKGKKKPYYLQVAIPLPRYSQIFRTLWWKDALLLGLMFLLSFMLSWSLSRRLLKPVAAIAQHLQKMDPERIDDWKPLVTDEKGLYLGDIVRGLNAMTERTRAAVLQLRKMGRYVAHELRTPLTVLRGEAEVVLQKQASADDYVRVLKSSLDEVQRMSETVDTVLQVGDWERAKSVSRPVALHVGTWVRENQSRWEKTLGRPILREISPEPAFPVSPASEDALVDPKLLHHLIDNLVRNIRDHAPADAQCRISVRGRKIIVSDNGPGLDPGMIEALNHNAIVSKEPPEGTGVGLSLCLKIAEICGIKLHVFNRKEGGLSVEITLPR